MHNVCLGVMKRLLQFWVKGKKDVRLTDQEQEIVSCELKNLKTFVPSEFCRLPRSLDCIEFWKATEFRSFLLYSGPIVLKNRLSKLQYFHFMLLHSAIKILISENTCQLYNTLAKELLFKFINDYSNIYDYTFITYNVHTLIHLPECVRCHGSLENYLQEFKKYIKCSRYPLQKLYNRIKEKQSVLLSDNEANNYVQYPLLIKEIFDCSCPNYKLYAKLLLFNCFLININSLEAQCFMLSNNNIVEVKHIYQCMSTKSIKLHVSQFLNHIPYFKIPISSNILGTLLVKTNYYSDLYEISHTDIMYTFYRIPISANGAIFLTLCHNTF